MLKYDHDTYRFESPADRWIAECFGALATHTALFAVHGRGLLSKAAELQVQEAYTQYREAYNSASDYYSFFYSLIGETYIEASQCGRYSAVDSCSRCALNSTNTNTCPSIQLLVLTFTPRSIWPMRCLDHVPLRGNARYYQCYLDEDMIRRDTWPTEPFPHIVPR